MTGTKSEAERAAFIAYASSREVGRPLAFPGVRRFEELFPTSSPWVSPAGRDPGGVPMTPGKRGSASIGEYLSIRPAYHGLRVKPSEDVVAYIRAHMLDSEWDTFHFQAVIHDNGHALVIVSHGQIIGSRWLAYIDADTLPAAVRS